MCTSDYDQQRLIAEAKVRFEEYSAAQKNFQIPHAHIEIDADCENATRVHMETEHNGVHYKFESIQEKDIDDVYRYLNSQPLVREKYADGIVSTRQQTTDRMNGLIERFRNKKSPVYLYIAFIVSDAQTENFLGFVNLGVGIEPGTAEMARLNRIECWSRPPSSAVQNYADVTSKTGLGDKVYSGMGTVETCTLLQYGAHLKKNGYKLYGHPLRAIVSTARIDNEGSWKSNAKAGMTLKSVNVVEHYGPCLRYCLQKEL